MATTRFYLDTRAARRDGTFPLKLSISQHGTSALISLDVFLTPESWDAARQVVVKLPNKRQLNEYITRRRLEIDDTLRELTYAGELRGLNASQVRALLLEKLDPDTEPQLFASYYLKCANAHESARTREIYITTFRHMQRYDARLDRLRFEDITKSWLDSFYRSLADRSPSVNARNIHLRNIRAVFNSAFTDGLTTNNPFRGLRIKYAPTIKRSLTPEELRAIFAADVKPALAQYRDAFQLMFLLMGINVVDLVRLSNDALHDGRLAYKRAKTGRVYDIKVEPEALAIMERYQGRGKLLSFGERCQDYTRYASRLNAHLQEIMPKLSTYYARHSWATIAARLGVPKDIIAAGLGHGASVTDVYIDFDRSKVDEANRKVIDFVLYGK